MAHETRPRTLDPDNTAPLEAWLTQTLGAGRVVDSLSLICQPLK
jgi:hypothetical protein